MEEVAHHTANRGMVLWVMGIRPHTCNEPTGDVPSMFWLRSRVKEKMLY